MIPKSVITVRCVYPVITIDLLWQAVRRLLEEAERVDWAEDQQYGPDRRGDELPEALRTKEGRLQRLQEAKRRLEAEAHQAHDAQAQRIRARAQQEAETGRTTRGRKPKAPAQLVDHEAKVNLTDPESRTLKTRQGWVQGDNGQEMADCASQVIVACAVTSEENDVRQLAPMLARCAAQAGERPTTLIADARATGARRRRRWRMNPPSCSLRRRRRGSSARPCVSRGVPEDAFPTMRWSKTGWSGSC